MRRPLSAEPLGGRNTLSSLRWVHASWIGPVVGSAAFSIAYLEWSFGAVTTAILGFAAILCFLTALASLVWGLLARRRIGIVIGACALLALAVPLVFVGEIDKRRKAESMRRGDEIFAALSSFFKERGRYPNSLDELVPDFLPKIPITASAVLRDIPFHYHLSNQDGFALSFPAPAWLICYRTESTSWACDD